MWLWQVKEYRIDRLISHLKSGDKILKNNLFYILVFILFISYFTFLKNSSLIFQYLALILFASSFLQIINEIKKRSFKRPKPTLKIVLIFLLLTAVYSMIVFCWISSFSITEETKLPIENLVSGVVLILFIYIVNSLVISSIILTINPFFNFQKRKIIKKASEKMKKMKKVKVIGITGSYGKTSTKEFLYTILSQKYKVVKTQGNNNTNIGVAYTILNNVSDKYDYFICEMGAYKIGEIAEICSIANPKIGILTGINEQHVELFGSIENTRKAKFELIEALPENGLAIIHSSIKYQVLSIKVKNIKHFSFNDIYNIRVYQDYVEFDLQTTPNTNCHSEEVTTKNPATMHEELNNGIATSLCGAPRNDSDNDASNIIKFKLNLLGKHYVKNIISAIMVAGYLGMNLDEIAKAVKKIEPTEYMMKKSIGPNNSVFIDDSYSANPDGVMAALDYLNETYQNYKKIIVFPGIIELGNKSKEVHQKLFGSISKICDTAYILNTEYQMLNNENNCKFIFEKDFSKAAEMIKKDLDKKTVVLFESRGAGVVMKKIKNE
ncbi:MAG: UDP-N-acetylmuramoyl-tripeptide--D-alanyl-D-alanine ligase [Candidatus Pacebacteria bacterium]|nr:UDP-N-acetylmuramoyl-tripeptide--D-alanyl-D-alanine ligase [Candidatus Paceibacterota bacterium]